MQVLEALKILTGVGMPLYGKLQLFDALSGCRYPATERKCGIKQFDFCESCLVQ
jgi:molybdopterin/thiamine biosynthesis adenylyltransferase